jgi:hypothetical protein
MKNKIKKIIYFIWQIYGIVIKDYKINCPAEIKREFIKEIQGKNKFKTFIETGTYLGDTLEFLKDSFYELISIELSDEYYVKAIERFKTSPNIKIVHGDSGERLPEILKTIKEPCIFWLDGHYSSGNTARGEIDTPIYKEISAILGSSIKNHTVLIDDARLFFGKNDYPWLPNLKRYIDRLSQNCYHMSITKDIIVLTPKK